MASTRPVGRLIHVLFGVVLMIGLPLAALGHENSASPPDDGSRTVETPGHDPADDDGPEYEGGEVEPGVSLEGSDELTLESAEVQFLADLHGIDLEQALELSNWMFNAEVEVARIRSDYSDTFAGSEFLHENGDMTLEIWFVDPGAEQRTAARQIQLIDGTSVAVRDAPLSEQALHEQFDMIAGTDPSIFGAVSRFDLHGALDFRTGEFIPEDPEVLESLEQDSHDACTHGTGGWIEGGRSLLERGVSAHYDASDGCTSASVPCTTGFTARLNGWQGILTAGHCLENLPVDYRLTQMYANGLELHVSLKRYDFDTLPDDDAGFAREVYDSGDAQGRIYLDPGNGWRNITQLLPDAAPLTATRCIKSAGWQDIGAPPNGNHALGFKCGQVVVSSYVHFGFAKFTKVENASWNDFPREGASGGPWFNVGAAAGTHTDSVTDAGIYYRLREAENALPGLDIYCGGTSEYICTWP